MAVNEREMKGGGGGAGLVHRVLASAAKAKARPKQMGKQNPQTRTSGRTGKRRGQETRRLQQIGSRCWLKTRDCFSVSVRAQSKPLLVLYDGIYAFAASRAEGGNCISFMEKRVSANSKTKLTVE